MSWVAWCLRRVGHDDMNCMQGFWVATLYALPTFSIPSRLEFRRTLFTRSGLEQTVNDQIYVKFYRSNHCLSMQTQCLMRIPRRCSLSSTPHHFHFHFHPYPALVSIPSPSPSPSPFPLNLAALFSAFHFSILPLNSISGTTSSIFNGARLKGSIGSLNK